MLKKGDKARFIEAYKQDGNKLKVYPGNSGTGWLLVYFYPADNTPGCTEQACSLRDAWSDLQAAGVQVIGVSADGWESHKQFAREHDLSFPLVEDPNNKIAQSYGVTVGGEGRNERVSFLINPEGRVAQVYTGINTKTHGQDVLKDVRALQA